LDDTVNNLRVVFQTEVPIPTACLDPSNITTNSADKSSSNNGLMDCVEEYSKKNDTSITYSPVLEYSEITNVPIGEWFQITVILRNKFIELYQDGNLYQTTHLMGTPLLNPIEGRFGFANPYNGRITNFRYMPFALTVPVIKELYAYESNQSFIKEYDPMQDSQ